jgi:hypothetical protein
MKGMKHKKVRRNEWKSMEDNKVNEMKKGKAENPNIWKRNRVNFEMTLEDRNETYQMTMKP